MNSQKRFFAILTACLISGCASDKVKVERGPQGTIAYNVSIEASEPGVKIEVDGDYVGTTPLNFKIWGDRDGTFHNFGRYSYTIRALPKTPGQLEQVKVFHTGGWFTPEDRIPNRIYFEMAMVPVETISANKTPPVSVEGGKPKLASGTGFFITEDGYLVTNHHVIKDAEKITVLIGSVKLEAKVVEKDIQNDLALLKVDCTSKPLPIGNSTRTRAGEEVFTLGYPNPDEQGLEVKFTSGRVSSLTGLQDDFGHFQISVPVQPGNSGGPLIDGCGNVVGVVDSGLNSYYMLAWGKAIPQNVNHAIKSSRINNLLERQPTISERLVKPMETPGKSFADLGEQSGGSVVLIEVLRH